jgi:hypothetical protein
MVTLDLAAAKPIGPGGALQAAADEAKVSWPIARDANGPVATKAWPITARVKQSLELSPSVLDFGEIPAGSEPPAPRAITLTSADEIEGLKASCGTDAFEVAVSSPSETPQGPSYLIMVTPRLRPQPGPFRVPLEVEARTRAGAPLRSASLLVGNVAAEMRATPGSIHFGALAVGRSAEERLSWAHRDGHDFTVLRTRCFGDGLEVVPLAPGTHGTDFMVRFRVGAAGAFEGRVEFDIQAADGRMLTQRVRVGALGTTARRGVD